MSKTKKIISAFLAIIVLVGVGFGAYILFGKKSNSLTESRAIKLVNETSDKINSTISYMGNGVANDNSVQTSTNINSIMSSNLLDFNDELSSLYEDYEDYFDKLTRAKGFFEKGNYALSLSGSQKINFDKTYYGESEDERGYFTFYHTDEIVVMEFSDFENDFRRESYYGIVEYDKEKNIPSAFYYFHINEYVTSGDIDGESCVECEYELNSLDFSSNKFYYVSTAFSIADTDTLASLNVYRNKLANATLVWNDIKDLTTEESVSFYKGNIANSINNVDMVSVRMLSEHSNEYINLFNGYKNNIKHLDVIALNNSKVDYNNAIKSEIIDGVFGGMLAAEMGTQRQIYCKYNNSMDKLLFYFAEDFKEFDTEVINKLKNVFENLEYSDLTQEWNEHVKITVENYYGDTESDQIGRFNIVKRAALDLIEFYQAYKNESYYVSILLGYGEYYHLSNSYVETKIGFDREKNSFRLSIRVDKNNIGSNIGCGCIYVELA